MARSEHELRARINSVPHWYHQIEVAPGVVTPGINRSSEVLRRLDLPADCRGLRALDIGARDGFFSFELERRGAEVLAIECVPPEQTGFLVASELLGSAVRYEVLDVYDLDPRRHGTFDLVLFLGVIYHLRHPLLAIDRIRAVARDRLWLESHVIDQGFLNLADGQVSPLAAAAPRLAHNPVMQFYPGGALNGDTSNWWGPNMACLESMLESAGFVVDRAELYHDRGIVQCHV
ncbi:MAG TPA: methyltransferase domain-containing protein [Herpetosiphonaceae bacterium]|nr:methyltransferase domain-containing protein [Herpetosiphonaceae bacterium]